MHLSRLQELATVISIARSTAVSPDDQIPQQFPTDDRMEAAAALTQYSREMWTAEHTAALQTSTAKTALRKNTGEDNLLFLQMDCLPFLQTQRV